MKILVIGTPKSGAKQIINGISKQGYELFDEPFIKKDWIKLYPNYMNFSEVMDFLFHNLHHNLINLF